MGLAPSRGSRNFRFDGMKALDQSITANLPYHSFSILLSRPFGSPTMAALRSLNRTIVRSAPLYRSFSTSPISRVATITIVGRLAATPELHTTSTGKEIVRYAVGTSTGPRDNQQTSWWKVSTFVDNRNESYKEKLLSMSKG